MSPRRAVVPLLNIESPPFEEVLAGRLATQPESILSSSRAGRSGTKFPRWSAGEHCTETEARGSSHHRGGGRSGATSGASPARPDKPGAGAVRAFSTGHQLRLIPLGVFQRSGAPNMR